MTSAGQLAAGDGHKGAPRNAPDAAGSGGGPQSGGRGSFGDVAGERPVVICCGPGGVGKTTVSAAIALRAAMMGRRSCVVTVDPARRLASSLGVDSLPNTATPVEGDWPGELHALMLDAKGTFDDLVHRYARTPEQADSILSNRLYHSLAGALSGTQEYMAMEKLYELTDDGKYDVVVVDTPPTRNALELLEAPSRLTHFLSNRIFRALLMPTRAYLKAVGVATQALLRTIAKVAGAEIVQDAVAFFQAFQGMEEGFRNRAGAVHELLRDPGTAYVLVSSPREDAIEEASYFADKLGENGVRPAGLVVNRVHPRFVHRAEGREPAGEPTSGARASGNDGGPPSTEPPSEGGREDASPSRAQEDALAQIEDNLRRLEEVAAREEELAASLYEQAGGAPVARVPLLRDDVHDVHGLRAVTERLFEGG